MIISFDIELNRLFSSCCFESCHEKEVKLVQYTCIFKQTMNKVLINMRSRNLCIYDVCTAIFVLFSLCFVLFLFVYTKGGGDPLSYNSRTQIFGPRIDPRTSGC